LSAISYITLFDPGQCFENA